VRVTMNQSLLISKGRKLNMILKKIKSHTMRAKTMLIK